MNFFNKSRRPHKKKLQTMILSVFLAVTIWFMVMSLTDPNITTTVSNLNIRFVGEQELHSKRLGIMGKSSIPVMSVTINGSRTDLMNYMDDIYIQADVSDISASGSYELTGTVIIPTTRISIEKNNNSVVPVTVEQLMSKDINVTVNQTGSLRNRLVKSVVENPTVTITGVQSEIEEVSGAVAAVDISQMTENNRQRLSYMLTDESGSLISENETIETARSEVDIINTLYEAKSLPVVPKLSPELEKKYVIDTEKTVISPQSVTVGVSGGGSADTVTALIDRLSDGSEQEYRLQGADDIYIPPDSETVMIKPELKSKNSAQLTLDVAAENVKEGLSAYVEGPVTMIVRGEDERITAETVHAYVDVSGLEEGSYSLPVKLRENGFRADGNYTVTVKIENNNSEGE